MRTGILYIHGFRSSPQSAKANLFHALTLDKTSRLAGCSFDAPQLPASPLAALDLLQTSLDRLNSTNDRVCLIGSSLGGFYASVLLERRAPSERLSAAVLNPGIFPARDLQPYVGRQEFWHDPAKKLDFTMNHVKELFELERELPPLKADLKGRYALLACTGDETLDYSEMVDRYGHSKFVKLVEGSDHGISDMDQHLDFILDFICAEQWSS